MTLKKKLILIIIAKYLLIIMIVPLSNLSNFLTEYKSKGLTISTIEVLFNTEPVEGYLRSIVNYIFK